MARVDRRLRRRPQARPHHHRQPDEAHRRQHEGDRELAPRPALDMSLAGRQIGCLLVHHLGHDKTKSYGDSTKEWQLDYVILGEGVETPTASISLGIEFKKARRRRPETMADFGHRHHHPQRAMSGRGHLPTPPSCRRRRRGCPTARGTSSPPSPRRSRPAGERPTLPRHDRGRKGSSGQARDVGASTSPQTAGYERDRGGEGTAEGQGVSTQRPWRSSRPPAWSASGGSRQSAS